MRVLVFCYEYPPYGGGAGSALAHLAGQWVRRGHAVSVVTGADRASSEERDGVRLIRLATGRRQLHRAGLPEMARYMIAARAAAEALYRSERPDIAVNFFALPGSGTASLHLKKRKGLRFVTELRGSDVPGPGAEALGWLYAATGPLLRRIGRESSGVIAVGEDLAGRAERSWGLKDIAVIPNGVDTERFTPAERHIGEAVRILYCGRLHEPQKRVSGLIRAVSEVRGALLDIIGDGPDRASYEALARKCSVADRVRFYGWLDKDKLPALYGVSDIFVNASPAEGMPNAVLEAMSAGCALILSDIPTHHELASEPDNTLFFDPSQPSQLASKLRALCANPGLRRRMGEYNRRRVLERHRWPELAQRHIDVFEKALSC